jgi:hypothetical protein
MPRPRRPSASNGEGGSLVIASGTRMACPPARLGFSGESIGALDSADLHAAVHHQSDHPQQADDGEDEKQGVGVSFRSRAHQHPPHSRRRWRGQGAGPLKGQ